MLDSKMIGLTMVFGAVMGFWWSLTVTENLLSVWNFIAAFIVAFAAFLIVYYFYKYFY